MLPVRYWACITLRRGYGDGTSGSIRAAGGGIGKMGEVNEEQYFRRLVKISLWSFPFDFLNFHFLSATNN